LWEADVDSAEVMGGGAVAALASDSLIGRLGAIPVLFRLEPSGVAVETGPETLFGKQLAQVRFGLGPEWAEPAGERPGVAAV